MTQKDHLNFQYDDEPTTIMTQVDLKISFWSLESYLIEYNQMLSNIIETYPV